MAAWPPTTSTSWSRTWHRGRARPRPPRWETQTKRVPVAIDIRTPDDQPFTRSRDVPDRRGSGISRGEPGSSSFHRFVMPPGRSPSRHRVTLGKGYISIVIEETVTSKSAPPSQRLAPTTAHWALHGGGVWWRAATAISVFGEMGQRLLARLKILDLFSAETIDMHGLLDFCRRLGRRPAGGHADTHRRHAARRRDLGRGTLLGSICSPPPSAAWSAGPSARSAAPPRRSVRARRVWPAPRCRCCRTRSAVRSTSWLPRVQILALARAGLVDVEAHCSSAGRRVVSGGSLLGGIGVARIHPASREQRDRRRPPGGARRPGPEPPSTLLRSSCRPTSPSARCRWRATASLRGRARRAGAEALADLHVIGAARLAPRGTRPRSLGDTWAATHLGEVAQIVVVMMENARSTLAGYRAQLPGGHGVDGLTDALTGSSRRRASPSASSESRGSRPTSSVPVVAHEHHHRVRIDPGRP